MNSILAFGTEGVYESSVRKYFNNQVRLCLIGKLRYHNGIKNFNSYGHPHGSVQSILILQHTQIATLKL